MSLVCACACVWTYIHVHAIVPMWKSEDHSVKSILSFHSYVEVLGVEPWPSGLHSNSLYLLSCLAGLCPSFFIHSLLGFAILTGGHHLPYICFSDPSLCQAPSSSLPSLTLDASHVFEFPEHAVLINTFEVLVPFKFIWIFPKWLCVCT